MMEDIGLRIKEIRKKNAKSLNDIALESGLSTGYLSKVERGITTPTIFNLHKICRALNITFNNLFLPQSESIFYSHKDRQTIIEYSDVKYEAASAPDIPLKANIMILHPKAFVKSSKHTYNELGLILEGEIEIIVNDVSYTLEKGDTLFIKQGSEHSMINHQDTDNISYWVKALSQSEPYPQL